MSQRTVRDPKGREWTVQRRWEAAIAFRRREHERQTGAIAAGSAFNVFDGSEEWILALLVVAGGVLAFISFTVFVFVAIALLILLLLAGVNHLLGLAGRLLAGRPWLVDAHSGWESRRYHVRGWGASQRAIEAIADELRADGERVPRPADVTFLGTVDNDPALTTTERFLPPQAP